VGIASAAWHAGFIEIHGDVSRDAFSATCHEQKMSAPLRLSLNVHMSVLGITADASGHICGSSASASVVCHYLLTVERIR
jgi:hypothetical protein